MTEERAVMFLVSAPSGAGKTTLCQRLLEEMPDLEYSVSSTTRPPREGEVNGKDYDFLSRETFDRLASEGVFLEHAEVHGNGYGTRRDRVFDRLKAGVSVLMDVDVQGADQIRAALQRHPDVLDRYVDVFIEPPSLDALRERLEGRGKDDAEVIERRLRNAQDEMDAADRYQHRVVNDDLDAAYSALRKIYLEARSGH
jgi:guanylate kinase